MGKIKTKGGHSSYWLDNDLWNTDDDVVDAKTSSRNDIAKIIRLATVRRAISNFVSILSGKNVPVHFQGEESYTNGEYVVIAADDNPKNFDVAVGLALHEASHILLSDFRWLKMLGNIDGYIQNNPYRNPHYDAKDGRLIPLHIPQNTKVTDCIFLPEILDAINKSYLKALDENPDMINQDYVYGSIAKEYIRFAKIICNILEDRRIDQYVYNTAMGYRPYYNALYDKYFYTTEISKYIRLDPEARIPSMENYINHMIYHIHPDSDPDALPGLRAIFKEMDLNNVHLLDPTNDPIIDENTFYYENTPRLWQKANDILAMIVKFVDLYVEFNKNGGTGEDGEDSCGFSNEGSTGEGDYSNEMLGDSEDSIPEFPSDMAPRPVQTPRTSRETPNSAKAQKELERAKDFLNGDTKKKKITKADSASVKAMEEAKGEMVDISVGGFNKVKCMVTRDLTEELLSQDWFMFSWGMGSYYVDANLVNAIAEGRRMGQILHQRLQIRNDPMTTRQTRLSSGKIERRLLANLGMDNTDVFYRSRTDKHKPVMLHLTIDASGSMTGSKFRKAMTVATAMAFLSSKMENVDCVISLRGGEKFPIVAVVFDSRRDHFRKWMKFAPHLTANGNTPEGLCFAATMDIILESKGTHDIYFINFSDGMPGFFIGDNASIKSGPSQATGAWYQNDFALDHTRKMVKHLRENGVKILSYFISDYGDWGGYVKADFKHMYGEDAEFVDVSSVTNVLSTLNKRLAKR